MVTVHQRSDRDTEDAPNTAGEAQEETAKMRKSRSLVTHFQLSYTTTAVAL